MISVSLAREMALSFDEATEQPHFEKTSFRVKKKIFATLDLELQQVVLKFSEADQSVFCEYDPTVIYPVAGGWGKKGWTLVELNRVPKELFLDALATSYCQVAPKKLADKYRP